MICYNPAVNEVANILVPRRFSFFILISLLAACNYPNTPAAPTVDIVATAVAGTLTAEGLPTLTATSPSLGILLPHSVYYISEGSGSAQVWRLEADGVIQTQITQEADPVDGYDVSRLDGSVAYVTNNQLYLSDSTGSNRRLLVDNSSADNEASDFIYRQRIGDPRFSPDGEFLAYAFDGIWILDLSNNQAIQLLNNSMGVNEEEAIVLETFYTPLAWSPNSQLLLLSVGGFESSTLAILNTHDDPTLTEIQSSGAIICCQVAWAPNSESVLIGSPYIGLIEPGLWRYDADNGEQSELIGDGEGGLFEFVGWPLELADGSLRYFYTSATEIPAGDLPLYMVSSDSDGVASRAELRPDAFSNIGEVLWADDGSLALVVQLNPSGGTSGTVVVAYSDGKQTQNLISNAWNIRWGP